MKPKIISITVFLTCFLLSQNIVAQSTSNQKHYQTNSAFYTLLENGTMSLDSFIVQPNGMYRIPDSILIEGNGHIVSIVQQQAFIKSKELTSVFIPAGVDSIGYGIFGNCFKLMEIVVDEENKSFKSDDGILYSKDGTKLYFFPIKKSQYQKGRYVVNENVKEIADFAFANNFYKQFILSEVEKIGIGAFYRCSELEYIFIDNSVSDIGELAFAKCEKLEHVNFQEGSKLKSIKTNTFSDCYMLSSFDNFPQHIENIGDYAFDNCYDLVDFTVPNGVTLIGEFAFSNCQKLKTITLPESLKTISIRSFYNCLHLISVTIPDHVTEIGEGAFIYCEKLESVKLPDKLDSLKPNTFAYCKKLKSIDFPATLRTIGDHAFKEAGLESIVIPKNIISYGAHFIEKCTNLTSVIFLNNSQILPDSIFFNFKKLKSVILNDDLLLIGASAFESSGITQIEIPDKVMVINNNAFASCTDLCSVKLNPNLFMIKQGAFYSCRRLKNIELPEKLLSIGKEAFYHCDSLKSITIPFLITKIEMGTFRDCYELAEIHFNNNIDSIMSYAFEGCQFKLERVILPESLKYLGDQAFAYCYSLTYINIPESLTRIPANVLKENFRLNYISIPATVTEIGESAFECNSAYVFDIYIHGYEPPAIYDSNVFLNDRFPRRVIYIPKGSKKIYKADPKWKNLNLKEMEESIMPE